MASLTFPELQQKMQLEKKKSRDVKYAFRNAEDIYTTFKELKSDWSVIVTDELIELTGRIFVKATAVAFKNDEKSEKHQSTAYSELSPVPVFNTQKGQIKQMQEPQWTGAVSSYARKYALQGLFAIGEKDVDDLPVSEDQQQTSNQNQKQEPENKQSQSDLISNDQYKEVYGKVRILAQLKNANFDQVANYVLQHFKIRDFHDIPEEHFETVMSYLNSQIAKAQGQNFNNL